MELRVIIDGAGDGAWNMALDEALLESAACGIATLRFYGWSEPTLSLGYFQHHADRRQHSPSVAVPLVRRATGGGAIVHDRELTYSLTVPVSATRSATETRRYYDVVHGAAVQLLAEMGIPSDLWCEQPGNAAVEPFLCFQRRAAGDVVAEGQKLLGSAQRRARGGLLQHGSLLLETSPAAPEIVGMETWLSRVPDPAELILAWAERVGTKLAFNCELMDITGRERERAARIRAAKFANSSWTLRR